jgi:MFS family permease
MNKLILTKVSLIVVSRMLGLFVLFPIFSILSQDYQNYSPLLIGLAIGIYGLTQAVFQIPFGMLSDRYGRKIMILIGLAFFVIGSLVSALTTDIYWVILGRFLQGLGAISSVLMAFVIDNTDEQHRTKALAIIGGQIGLAFMVAILLGPILAINFGISGVFWFITILASLAFLVAITLKKQTLSEKYAFNLENLKSIFVLPLLRLNISVFFLHIILTSTFVVLPMLWLNNNIVPLDDHWKVYLTVMASSFILMVPLILALEKYKKINFVFISSIIFIMLASFVFFKIELTLVSSLLILMLFFTGFNVLEAVLPSLIARQIDSSKRGMAMGFHGSSQFLGAFLGGLLGGYFFGNYGTHSVFLMNSLIALIWLFFIIFNRKVSYGGCK